MTLLKDTDFKAPKTVGWPQQLTKPDKLMKAIRLKSKLCLINSPICSKIVLQIVGGWCYFQAHVMNKSRVFNIETFNQELRRIETQNAELSNQSYTQQLDTDGNRKIVNRETSKRAPLLTLSNHISCLDDPVLWGSLLPMTYYSTNTDSVRWAPAAIEICFSKAWHSAFFSLGKTFPIRRGGGVNQPAMDFALALLKCNQWLHLFPEGRVMRDDQQRVISNSERGYIFKWGISKLILDYFKGAQGAQSSERNLIKILPFYHLGMDEILPIGWPYIPKFGRQITIFIRPSVIDMNLKLLNQILTKQPVYEQSNKSRSNDEISRIKLTNYFEEEVEKLIEPATILHESG